MYFSAAVLPDELVPVVNCRMPAKKPSAKHKKSRAAASKQARPTKQKSIKRKKSKQKQSPKKKASQRKMTAKRVASPGAKQVKPGDTRSKERSYTASGAFLGKPGRYTGGQAGDLQGLSRREGADSESVDELLEEGNPFEAGVVAGVERADDADEKEVRSHEVPEDDVPGEYLDKDQ
jgi:hypothetical protein